MNINRQCDSGRVAPASSRHPRILTFRMLPGWRRYCLMLFLAIALGLIPAACNQLPAPKDSARTPSPPAAPAIAVRFTDITKQAGIDFIHNHGGFGKKYLPESMGSGCAFLDYNSDGAQDILLINSKDWPEHKSRPSYMALYRNNQNSTFTNVTHEAGLEVELYALGTAIADYDNDGDQDVFITCLESDRLFQNNGNGTFADITVQAGLQDSDFGSSATWFDYDRDGYLDLFVCNYVRWSVENDLYCTLDGVHKSYCTPESYQGSASRLYRNTGKSTFTDVTTAAGLHDPTGKSLGVVVFDYDMDGWPDLLVANDTEPNKLYPNNGNGTFTEKGAMAGVAFSESGVARAGMGVDAADYDGSGYPSLLIGNFANEMLGLYHNEGTGLFIDEAPASTVGQASLLTLTFGAFFFDFDLDGLPDIFAANGHVHDDIEKVQKRVTYAEAPHLFRNTGSKRFERVADSAGDLANRMVARGAAYGDIDNDGDLDILVSTNGGPPHLFRNEDGNRNHFLRFKTTGTRSNADGIGTRIVIHFSDGRNSWQTVKAGSSYCSQSEMPVTFGLGKHTSVAQAVVYWPSGKIQKLQNLRSNQTVTLREPQ